MASRERVEFDVVGNDRGGSKAFRAVGDAADKAADQIDDLGKTSVKAGDQVEQLGDRVKASGDKTEDTSEQYRGLAADIALVEGNVRRLAAEIDATGNKELFKDLRKQQSELRKLVRVKDLLPDDSESHAEAVRFGGRIAAGVASGLSRAGGPISAALSNVFGVLPPQAQVGIGAGLVGAVTATAPAIGAVLAGAVTGAAGTGGIVGGVAIAAKHPQVQAAARATGNVLTEELHRAAVSFVPATVESLGIVQSEIGEIGDDLKRAFSAAAPMLAPLTRDVLSGAESAVEGFATAVERSGPVVRTLGDIAERAGDLVGDTFVELSENAYTGGRAVAALWGVFEGGTRVLVNTVSGLTEVYGAAEKFSAVLTGDRDKLVQLITEEHNAKAASGGLSTGMQDLLAAVQGFGGGAADAAGEVRSLGQAIDEATGKSIDSEQAQIRLEEAIDRAAEAAKKNGDGIDRNIPKQRANREALIGIADAAKTAAAKILDEGGSQEDATAASERGRRKFLETAAAMKVKKSEAIALANKLFGIPNVDRTVTVKTSAAQAAIARVQAGLGKINSKDITIGVWYKTNGDLKLPGGTQLRGASEGGMVVGRGPKGVDSEPYLLAPGEGILTAREVDALGGPAGFEQLRTAIRGQAAAPAPALTAGAGSGRARAAGTDEEVLYRAFVRALRTVPVGRDAGRVADIYTRGG